jgi:hypothetical protein
VVSERYGSSGVDAGQCVEKNVVADESLPVALPHRQALSQPAETTIPGLPKWEEGNSTVLARLDELEGEEWVREDTAERLRGLYGFRRNRFLSRFDENDDGAIEEQSLNYQRLRRELFDAERGAIVDLRRRGVIDDEVQRRLYRELDLEDARLEV